MVNTATTDHRIMPNIRAIRVFSSSSKTGGLNNLLIRGYRVSELVRFPSILVTFIEIYMNSRVLIVNIMNTGKRKWLYPGSLPS